MSYLGTRFTYNDISSDDMGVMLISMDTSFLKRSFGLQKNLNTEKIKNRDIPLYYGVEKQVYPPIPITICKINANEPWTDDEYIKISEWLFGDDDFHDFISEDYPSIIFPLQFTKGEHTFNGNKEGYIELEAVMNSPYPFMIISSEQFDLSDNTTTTMIEVENRSNVITYYKPVVEFTLLGNTTSIKVRNLTVGGELMQFDNLQQGEILCVDNQTQRIESSTGQERITNFNLGFLRLVKGKNKLEVTGKCLIEFKYRFPIMI